MGRICEEVNRRLKDEQPDLDKEIGNTKTQMAETEVRLARYFEAFESGAMSPELCGPNVGSLRTRLEELEAENRRLEARRKGIEVPTLGRGALPAMVDSFEEVMASGTNPQKKTPPPQDGEEGARPRSAHNRNLVWFTRPKFDRTLGKLAPAVGLEAVTPDLQSGTLPLQNRALSVQNPMNHNKLTEPNLAEKSKVAHSALWDECTSAHKKHVIYMSQ